MTEYLKPREVADTLRVNMATVYRWIKAGQLDAVRLPDGKSLRIPAKSVSDMLTPDGTSANL